MIHSQSRLAAAMVLGMALIAPALGQTRPAAPGGAGAAAPGPVSIRDRIMGGMKTALACSDDEWKVLEPKLVKVLLLKIDTGALGMFNRGGRGGNRMSTFIRSILDPNALPSAVDEKMAELQTMIEQNETSTDAYKNKLAQVRRAREQAKENLAAAEKAATALLTLRQEAALVQLGILD